MSCLVLLLLLQDPVRDGVAALEQGRLAEAQAKFEQAAKLAPRQAGPWLLLAETYARQKKAQPALAAADRAEKLGWSDADVVNGLAHFFSTLQPDLPRAARLGARYAELRPEDTTAWRRVAALYLDLGQPEQAIAAARRGLPADDSAELHGVLGRAYAVRKEWPNAVAELKRALELSPYSENAHFQLAQAYLLQQKFPEAIAALENARRTFDKSPQIELALGVARYGARDFRGAVDQFLKTIRLAPGLPQPYVFLGRILEHAGGRLPEAAARFAALHERNPQNPLGYVLHAKAIVLQLPPAGYPPEAAAAFELLNRAVALKADNAETHYLLGVLLDRKGDYAAAAAQLERSVALNAKDPAPHYRLARVYARLGRKEDAAVQRRLHEKLSAEEGQ